MTPINAQAVVSVAIRTAYMLNRSTRNPPARTPNAVAVRLVVSVAFASEVLRSNASARNTTVNDWMPVEEIVRSTKKANVARMRGSVSSDQFDKNPPSSVVASTLNSLPRWTGSIERSTTTA